MAIRCQGSRLRLDNWTAPPTMPQRTRVYTDRRSIEEREAVVDRGRVVNASGLTRRRLLGLGVGLGVMAACGPLGEQTKQATGTSPSGSQVPSGPLGKVTLAMPTDAKILDPTMDISYTARLPARNMFDALTDVGRDGSLLPALAESWESRDAMTWTFKIREGVKFHNGATLTADDVVWTYQMIAENPKSPNQSYFRTVSKVEKADERTVRVVMKSADAVFPRLMYVVPIVPRADYLAKGPERFAREPVGTGPYKFVNWVKDDHIELEATGLPHFSGTASVKSVIFRTVPSASARIAGLESGELDLVAQLPPPEVPRLQQGKGLRVVLHETNKNVQLGMNATAKPLDDVRVRQAIDLAIDRVAICRDLLRGLGKPTDQASAPSVFGFDTSRPLPRYDPDLARQLLRDAGYGSGLQLDFQWPTDRFAFGPEVAQAVAGYLEKVGIKTKQESMIYTELLPLWLNKKLKQLYMFALSASTMDADIGLTNIYRTFGYWTSPEFEALYAKQRTESDEKERLKLLKQITKVAGDAYPMSWLYTEIGAFGMRDRLEWTPWPDDRIDAVGIRLKA